jgi:hypothetical protein
MVRQLSVVSGQWSVEAFSHRLSAIRKNPRTKGDFQEPTPTASFIAENGLLPAHEPRTETDRLTH